MSEHPNAALLRKVTDAFNAGDMQAADYLSDDVVWRRMPPKPVRYDGKQSWA